MNGIESTKDNRIYRLNTDQYLQIMDILDEFDFNKVHKVMTFLKWEWIDQGVPEIEDLRKSARRLLFKLLDDPNITRLATGGFQVRRVKYGDYDNETISLEFILTNIEKEVIDES